MPHGKSLIRPVRPSVKDDGVFLNLPYDRRFTNLFLAYIAGVSCFGLVPRATLEIPGGARRLDRIIELLKSCRFSIHDLSRVQLDSITPKTPRFNMPFELGLSVMYAQYDPRHTWFVFEKMLYRPLKSLSDINGTDIYCHDGFPEGVFRETAKAFIRERRQPTVRQMRAVYAGLQKSRPRLQHDAGVESVFSARVFRELSVLASELAVKLVPPQ